MEQIKNAIQNGKTVLGIELGSTRIKAVLIDENNNPIASGSYEWENRLENGIWTYSLEDVWTGIQTSYKNMADDVKNRLIKMSNAPSFRNIEVKNRCNRLQCYDARLYGI